MFGSKGIRHMWRVANGLDNAALDGGTNVTKMLSIFSLWASISVVLSIYSLLYLCGVNSRLKYFLNAEICGWEKSFVKELQENIFTYKRDP